VQPRQRLAVVGDGGDDSADVVKVRGAGSSTAPACARSAMARAVGSVICFIAADGTPGTLAHRPAHRAPPSEGC
jgi:hypothetical protein